LQTIVQVAAKNDWDGHVGRSAIQMHVTLMNFVPSKDESRVRHRVAPDNARIHKQD
jgi:hypothetical protein